MSKLLSLAYGLTAYLVFLGVFVYLIGFVGDIAAPTSLDRDASGSIVSALLIDLGLLALFSLQHSVMARRGFKDQWTRLVPEHLERSTYVLAASGALGLLMWAWRPIPGVVWHVEHSGFAGLLWTGFAMGWVIVLLSTFLIDHFRLFGLKQVWSYAKNEVEGSSAFKTPGLYRLVRHPLYLGFIVAFWCTPRMTAGHLLFAGVFTSWIVLAIRFEERDLVHEHGQAYRDYRDAVRMLVPWPARRAATAFSRTSDDFAETEPRGA